MTTIYRCFLCVMSPCGQRGVEVRPKTDEVGPSSVELLPASPPRLRAPAGRISSRLSAHHQVLWKEVPSGSRLLIWKLHLKVMNESESFFAVRREIRLRGTSPKFSTPGAAALLSGLELVVCSDGWDRTVSGHEPASRRLLVFAFFFLFCRCACRSCHAWRRQKKKKKDLRGLPPPPR